MDAVLIDSFEIEDFDSKSTMYFDLCSSSSTTSSS